MKMAVQYRIEFIQGMGRGVRRVVEAENGREKQRRRIETGHEHVERGGRGGASSPFYSESGLPDCCQVTVGQSLDKMLTVPNIQSEETCENRHAEATLNIYGQDSRMLKKENTYFEGVSPLCYVHREGSCHMGDFLFFSQTQHGGHNYLILVTSSVTTP